MNIRAKHLNLGQKLNKYLKSDFLDFWPHMRQNPHRAMILQYFNSWPESPFNFSYENYHYLTSPKDPLSLL